MFLPRLARWMHTSGWRASPLRMPAALFSSWHVSSLGRTRNTRGQVFLGSQDISGYRRVQMTLPPKMKKNFYVHRLVAYAFYGPPSSPQLVVNHIDGDPGNNCLDNLEYATYSENSRRSRARSSQNPSPRSGKAVMVRKVGMQTWTTFPSMRQAAEAVGVHHSSVSHCCRGKQLTCQGHEFMLAPVTDLLGEIWAAAVCPATSTMMLGYQISTHGRMQGPTGFISHGSALKGYRRITFQGRCIYVHRIMAATFLKVPSTSMDWEVDHKDGNRANNLVDNLEVVTHSENMYRALAMRDNRGVVSTRRPVRGRRLPSDTWCSFSSVSEAADYVGGHVSNIIKCCKGKYKSCCGYVWEYADEPHTVSVEEWREVDVPGLLAAWDVKWLIRCSTPVEHQNGMPAGERVCI